MKTIKDFPRKTKVLEGLFIALSDGVNLAAKIWLPEDAETDPVPAIIEYLPYRYQDGTAERDALTHPYFAGHGYACVRVDMRGTGNSQGVLRGEYLKQEQDDALEIIEWATSQPWCTGSVGIIGISWGGFNGLQIAARQPEALKAIITLCSTDDRYADDIHYMGGAMLVDNISWSTHMFALNATPPDPQLHGDAWHDVWLDRLEKSGLWLEDWLEHQHRDEFYRHGSICENYEDIKCAVYAVGGWADAYSNAIFRLVSRLSAPCKGLIGPWAHKYPHFAMPGPQIGFLQECLRWWDYWLKDIDTGIMDEPKLRCWMQESAPPLAQHQTRPGRWVAEDEWPAVGIHRNIYHLNTDGLSERPGPMAEIEISSPQTAGLSSGTWLSFGNLPDLPRDQRAETTRMVHFDTAELDDDLEILGAPVLSIEFSCDGEDGLIAACLNEILPDGSIARITYGVHNLTHTESHSDPQPLVPGQTYRLDLQMNEIAHRFAQGSRIRLSLSNAYWPIVWPSPRKTRLTLSASACTLAMPVRAAKDSDHDLKPFLGAEAAAPLRRTVESEGEADFSVVENFDTGIFEVGYRIDKGSTVYDDYQGWTVESWRSEVCAIHPEDPCSAVCDVDSTEKFSRGHWSVRISTQTTVTSTPTHFVLTAHLHAMDDEETVYSKIWERRFRRKLV